MKHEKIFTRPDGTRFKIVVSLSTSFNDEAAKWDYFVLSCAPRKRTWFGVVDEDEYAFRALSMKDRDAKRKSAYLQFVSNSEITEAKLELWNKIKPL